MDAFRALGEPAIAGIVDQAVPSQSGGYRDTLRIAAVIGRFYTPESVRSAATKAAIDRILADDRGMLVLSNIVVRLTGPARS